MAAGGHCGVLPKCPLNIAHTHNAHAYVHALASQAIRALVIACFTSARLLTSGARGSSMKPEGYEVSRRVRSAQPITNTPRQRRSHGA